MAWQETQLCGLCIRSPYGFTCTCRGANTFKETTSISFILDLVQANRDDLVTNIKVIGNLGGTFHDMIELMILR